MLAKYPLNKKDNYKYSGYEKVLNLNFVPNLFSNASSCQLSINIKNLLCQHFQLPPWFIINIEYVYFISIIIFGERTSNGTRYIFTWFKISPHFQMFETTSDSISKGCHGNIIGLQM